MKKIIFAAALLPVLVFGAVKDIPKSITLESGKVKVRLDSRKFWNINRIEWQNELLSVDNPSAHYGMTFNPGGSNFFIGSGHNESGETEIVESLQILIDGKETVPAAKMTGKKIEMEKVSRIKAFTVKYSLRLENDTIFERTELAAKEDIKVRSLYCFMHPWSTRFTLFHGIGKDGKKVDFSLNSSEKFPNRRFMPSASFYDPASGIIAATVLKAESGSKRPGRLIWDRRFYRKDYLNDFQNQTFPAGHKAVYSAVTGFAGCKDKDQWIAAAEKLISEIEK